MENGTDLEFSLRGSTGVVSSPRPGSLKQLAQSLRAQWPIIVSQGLDLWGAGLGGKLEVGYKGQDPERAKALEAPAQKRWHRGVRAGERQEGCGPQAPQENCPGRLRDSSHSGHSGHSGHNSHSSHSGHSGHSSVEGLPRPQGSTHQDGRGSSPNSEAQLKPQQERGGVPVFWDPG